MHWRHLAAAVLVLAWVQTTPAQDLKDYPLIGRPVPSAHELSPPGDDIPAGIAAWYGRWSGLWDGKWPMVVSIQSIERGPDGFVATGRYYWRERLDEEYRVKRGPPLRFPVTAVELKILRVTLQREDRCRPHRPAPSARSRSRGSRA